MNSYRQVSDCAETLLDLICYEICKNSLSPEVEGLLADHLAECPECRERLSKFKETLAVEESQASLAIWTTMIS